MKRNWDTIREILLKVEECTLPAEEVTLSAFPAEREAEISYHAALLIEAGLVNGEVSQNLGPEVKDFFAHRLTWEGHEWEKTKSTFFEKGIEMTFDLVRSGAGRIAGAILDGGLGG